MPGFAGRLFARWFWPVPLLAIAFLLGSCATRDGGLEFPGGPPIPPAAPRVVGAERAGSAEHRRIVQSFGGEYRAPNAERLLVEIAARLAPATDRPDQTYQITLLDSATVNAFALPSGQLYLTRGLLALANDTAEIAAVLAHEVAHVTANHALARAELEKRSQIVSRVVAEVLNDPVAGDLVRDRTRVSIASFSRQQELEADAIGVRTLARARFDPYGATRFLNALARTAALRAGGDRGTGTPDMLATHPATSERVLVALAAARQIGAPGLGESDRQRYLAAIESIAYGEDPRNGAVRGRRFVHGQWGVSFTAPEGFALESGSEAVLGVAMSANRVLRFDTVRVDEATPLETYIASGWIEGVTPSDIQAVRINGLDAATGLARGAEWGFRMAAIRAGSQVYRFIFAAKAFTPDADRGFRDSVASFEKLDRDEASRLGLLRLRLLTAGPGDTPDGFAAQMSDIDNRLERFLVLNGLERGARLTTGQAYKIVGR